MAEARGDAMGPGEHGEVHAGLALTAVTAAGWQVNQRLGLPGPQDQHRTGHVMTGPRFDLQGLSRITEA